MTGRRWITRICHAPAGTAVGVSALRPIGHERATTVPVRRLLAALVAFYGIVTYQFVRASSLVERLPTGRRGAFGFDPEASLAVQYVDYLASATVGEWGHSLWYATSVSAVLLDTLPRLALLVGVGIVAAFTTVRLRARLGVDGIPSWAIAYAAYAVVFLAGLAALTTGTTGASGFYLTEARQLRDLPLSLGADRLVALGCLVGAVVVNVARRGGAGGVSTGASEEDEQTT